MSDTKQKVKVKVEVDEPSVKAKLAKSPKASDAAAVIKKGVKKESESPVGKKKDSETHSKAIKNEAGVINKTVKKELHAEASKTKKGEVTGQVKVVKKEEVLVSSGKTASPKDPLKKKKASKEEPEKKEKKVYSLPGQKHGPPDERDPLRIFYESLYEQNSRSEMAEVWMMEHGLLEFDAAKKAFERKKKNQVGQKLGSPVKQSRDVSVKSQKLSTNTTVKSEKKSSTVKSEKKSSTVNGDSKSSKAKRIRDSDDDEDDDFILKPKKKSKSSA